MVDPNTAWGWSSEYSSRMRRREDPNLVSVNAVRFLKTYLDKLNYSDNWQNKCQHHENRIMLLDVL